MSRWYRRYSTPVFVPPFSCPDCGCLVLDTTLHDEWHAEQGDTPHDE